jgi:hypothetical protein
MPLVFALVASTLLHVAALIGPGWVLPGTHEPDLPPTIEAVLGKPPVRTESVAPAAAPRPPQARPRRTEPGPVIVASEAAAAEVPVPPPPAVEPPPAATPPAPPVAAPVEAVAPSPAITALPGKGRLRYVITRGEGGFVIGQAVHSWEHDGFRYRLKSLTETTGLAALFKPAQVFQSSQGDVTAEGLRPHEFRHERSGGIDTASFDWLRRMVAYAGREQSVVGGTQDMLSMYYQLVLLAPKSGVLEMPIATGRKLENYRFEVLGEETLNFPSGDRRALRIKTRSGDDTIELWLRLGDGAARRGLPLKIRFIDRKGEIFDQTADDLDSAEAK